MLKIKPITKILKDPNMWALVQNEMPVTLVELHLQAAGGKSDPIGCRIPEDCSWERHQVHEIGVCEAISIWVKSRPGMILD